MILWFNPGYLDYNDLETHCPDKESEERNYFAYLFPYGSWYLIGKSAADFSCCPFEDDTMEYWNENYKCYIFIEL